MEERVYEVEMVYVQNTSGNNYTLETMGRRSKNVKLSFTDVEGVEINSPKPLEVKNSLVQMAEGQSKMWNMRFAFPTNLAVKYSMNRIVIEAL
jgi:hypothetical protein